MNIKQQAHLALILAGLLFGANYWIAKNTMPAFSPLQIVTFRISITTLLLFLIGIFIPNPKQIEKRDLLRILAAGILGVSANQLLFFMGLEHSSPVETSLLHTLSPLLVALFAVWILKETVTFRKFAGIIAGLAGAVIIVVTGKPLDLCNLHFTGNLMILLNISAYSLYLILIKPLMEKYSPFHVTKLVFLAGLITYLPFALFSFRDFSISGIQTQEWLSLVYVVFGTTLITYLLTNFAIRRLPATIIGFYIYMQPFIATSIGYFTGKEQLTAWGIIAAIFLFTGVWLVIGRKKN